jgi:hypothetical protein
MPTVIFGQDLNKGRAVVEISGLTGLPHLIAEAIATERERCARVAENMGRSNGRVKKPYKLIAKEIRSGNNRIGER